jgi:hypothetical protein
MLQGYDIRVFLEYKGSSWQAGAGWRGLGEVSRLTPNEKARALPPGLAQ